LENPAKATAIFQEIQTNYPTTPVGTQMAEVIKSLAPEVEKQKIRESLVPGTLLPDFNTTDLAGKPLSVAQYRGKVVLIDFWATWCPPCRRELPNVVAVYNQYHAQGFEVIGVTLDQDQARVASFIKDSNMPWPEHFEGTGWDNTLVAKYGVVNIPDNILIDAQGHVLGRALTGDVLAQAVAKALVK
jgi:thiol-disulfide isomerase/thioredoxin